MKKSANLPKNKIKPIQSIAAYNNIAFEEGGVRVWKAYTFGNVRLGMYDG